MVTKEEAEKENLKKFTQIFDEFFKKEMSFKDPAAFKLAYRTLWNEVILPSVSAITKEKDNEISDNRKVIAAAHMKVGEINKMMDSKRFK